MIRMRTIGIIGLVVIISYAVFLCGNIDVNEFIGSVLLPFGGALTGIVLATVAIVMGSVGATYAAIAAKGAHSDEKALAKAFSALDSMVNELRDDCVLVISCFGVLLAAYLLTELDIPAISFDSCRYLSKNQCLGTVSLASCIGAFIAMFDTVGAVFAMHKQTVEIAKQE